MKHLKAVEHFEPMEQMDAGPMIPRPHLAGLALSLLAATALTGCAMQAGFTDEVAERAGDSAEPFSLPTDDSAPLEGWSQVAVVCPYDDTASLPEEFGPATEKIDTSAHEGTAWLLFSDGAAVETLHVDRLTVDFCGSGSDTPLLAGPTDEWSARSVDDRLVVEPR
ncbi:hypothetical protein GCM10027591_15170 [Zhihengliuella somnathii]